MNRDWKIIKGLHGNLSFSKQLIQVRIVTKRLHAACFKPSAKDIVFVFSKFIENNVNLYQQKLVV